MLVDDDEDDADGRACGLAELRRRELGPANRANTRQRDLDLGVTICPAPGARQEFIGTDQSCLRKKRFVCGRQEKKLQLRQTTLPFPILGYLSRKLVLAFRR